MDNILEFPPKKATEQSQGSKAKITIESEGEAPIVITEVDEFIVIARKSGYFDFRSACSTFFFIVAENKIREVILEGIKERLQGAFSKLGGGKLHDN